MFDLSYRYNRYHKFTTTVVIVFTILFSITVLITNMLINSVNKDSMEKLMDQYGSFQFIMHNIDSSDDEYFKSDPELDSFGYIIHSGSYKLTDKEIWLTLGHIDEEAVRIGNIHLVEGNFPMDDYDICLEDHIRFASDPEMKIGDEIGIQAGDSVMSFRICGFIKDYRGYWQQSENSTEDTDYPNALISPDLAQANERSKSMVLYYRGIKTAGQFVSKSGALGHSMSIEKARNLVGNDIVYSSEMEFLSTPIRQYQLIFVIIYSLLGIYLFYIILQMHLFSFFQERQVLSGIGYSKKQVSAAWIKSTAVPFFIGFVLSLIAYVLFFLVFENGRFKRYLVENMIFSLIIISAYALSVFLIYRKREMSRIKEKTLKQYQFSSNYIFELYSVFTTKKIMRVTTLIIIMCMLLSMFFCIDYDKKYRSPFDRQTDYYKILVNSTKGSVFKYVGSLRLSTKITSFDYDYFKKIEKQLEGKVNSLKFSFSSNRSLVIPTLESAYWKEVENRSFYHEYIDTSAYVDPSGAVNIPKGIFTTEEYATFTLKDRDREWFKMAYPEIDIEKDLALGKVVMFFEPITPISWDPEAEYIIEDYYQPGDTIKLASIRYDGPFFEFEEHMEDIQYIEDELTISRIYREYFDFDGFGHFGSPLLLMTEETAIACNTIDGVETIDCLISKDKTEEEYTEIKKIFDRAALSGKDSKIYESKFYEDYYDQFYQMIKLSFYIIAILTGVSLIYSIYSLISMDIKENRFNSAVMRTFGIGKRDYMKVMLLEYLTYLMIGLILAISTTLIMVVLFSKLVIQLEEVYELRTYIAIILKLFAVLVVFALITVILHVKKLYSLDISEALRNDE